MENDYVVNKMNSFLHTAAIELARWLGDILPKTSSEWWQDCVLQKLSYSQGEIAKSKGISKLEDFDLAALLRIADKSWYAMRSVAYLPTKERECIREMLRVRNNWAHCGAAIPGKDAISYDLKTLHQFFEQINCSSELLREIEQFKDDVELPEGIIPKHIPTVGAQPPKEDLQAVESSDSVIKEKSLVYLVGDPSKRGIVFSVSNLGQTVKYELFIDGGIRTYYTGQIALVEEVAGYNWVDADTFRSYLTAYQINNPSARNLYSLNSARIDFVPYQFRPALKLIRADEPRILIADSVGVGKTIEAGLIIKELEARGDVENIMIICPKPLVAERKWELEMKRFDEEFVPLNGTSLRQILSDTDRDGEWPSRYSKVIVPYSILDSRIFSGDTRKKSRSYGLEELDPALHFDLVIIDEAHHIRNGSMDKEKAFAYKCTKYFCDHADAVVMLTATPLQTSDDDLFTLLNVLRPDVVIDKATFNMMTRPNEYISQCVRTIRSAQSGWQSLAIEQLQDVLRTQWGENVIANNPIYEDVIRRLESDTISRDDRVSLISDVESLHSFNTMLNRTRRKDIQDFCVRRSHTLETDFTPEQRTLHDELLSFEFIALSTLHNARSVPFMMSTIRRQAASCIFGLAPYIRDIINRRFVQMNDDPDVDFDIDDLDGNEAGALSRIAKQVLELADNLPEADPKFDSMLEIITQKQNYENNKIILFSTFRHTLAYLRKKLDACGLRVDQIDGSVSDERRLELRYQFELPKENPDAIDILLFTEVGSEGLDYQFCDLMINYDLPWNPMKIEQRIGRIDRRGQTSEVVNIYNAITADTVDADIYHRCLLRIGIFEKSIGDCEEILGAIGSEIEQIAVNTNLTDEERRLKLEQIADNEVRKTQEMSKLEDEEKEFFGFDLSNYTTAQEIQRAESPWLTQQSLLKLVENYLKNRLGDGKYIIGESEVKTLRLSAASRFELRTDFNKLPGTKNAVKRSWEIYLKGATPTHSITFDSDAAGRERNAFFVTSMHPLARQAAMYYTTNETAYINLEYASEDIPSGTYHFSVYAWNYLGLNPHFRLVTVCENDAVATELPDVLQSAEASSTSRKANQESWTSLEEKHVQMWMAEKDNYMVDVRTTATYKLESLKNSFMNRKRTLEQQIHDAVDASIIRMRSSELESATETYEKKIGRITEQASKADIHVTLIANGIITII